MWYIFKNKIVKNENLKTLEWKGKTFNQISSKYIYNSPNKINVNESISYLFRPNPLKIYRKEIASTQNNNNCYSRISLKISDFENPGMTIQNSNVQNPYGITNIIDINYENNKCEHPNGNCPYFISNDNNSVVHFLSPVENSLRRVRSSGMIKKNSKYFTNSHNYLDSRTKTFQKNESIHLISGNPLVKPGSSLSINNIYKSNGPQNCAKQQITYKPNNSKFAKQGSVSSSDLILRKKIDAINTAASTLLNNFGSQTANAEKYSVLNNKYTLKTRTGFDTKNCCKKGFSEIYY